MSDVLDTIEKNRLCRLLRPVELRISLSEASGSKDCALIAESALGEGLLDVYCDAYLDAMMRIDTADDWIAVSSCPHNEADDARLWLMLLRRDKLRCGLGVSRGAIVKRLVLLAFGVV